MKGTILDYTLQQSKGLISGEDGMRYHFTNAEWKSNEFPAAGLAVDFEADGDEALEIYIDPMASGAARGHHQSSAGAMGLPDFIRTDAPKSRLVYILLALFLGYFGVHNFYVGNISRAVIQLSLNVFAFLCFLLLGWLIIGIVIAIPLWLGLFVWVIVDICTVTEDAAGQPLQ